MHPKKLNIQFDDQYLDIELVTKQKLLSEVLEGKWSSHYKGRGMEFSEFRPYVYGDDASTIDWKASLRAGTTLVKVFEQTKNVTALIVFDVSDSMLFSSRKDGKMKAEYSAELISALIRPILRNGDAVGLLMFNEKVVAKVEPNIGALVEKQIKDKLLNPDNYGGHFDFNQAMKYVLSTVKTLKVVIILISDFIGLNEGWYKYIQILSQKYDLIGIMVKDLRDRFLPDVNSQIVFQDPSTNERIYVDVKKYAKLYHQEVLNQEREIEKWFSTSSADFLRLDTREDYYTKLVEFFNKRAILKTMGK